MLSLFRSASAFSVRWIFLESMVGELVVLWHDGRVGLEWESHKQSSKSSTLQLVSRVRVQDIVMLRSTTCRGRREEEQ